MKIENFELLEINECDLKNGELFIPKEVKRICKCATKDLNKLSNFNCLRFENDSAFEAFEVNQFKDCKALVKIDLSNCRNLKNISSDCFKGCSNLQGIALPAGLREIGFASFEGCQNLSKINFKDCKELRAISAFAFAKCAKLGCVDLSNLPIEEIGRLAFADCANMSEFSINGCDKLKRLEDFFISGTTVGRLDMRGAVNVENIGKIWSLRCNEFDVSYDLAGVGSVSFDDCFMSTTKINVYNKENKKLFTFTKLDEKFAGLKIVALGYHKMLNSAGIALDPKKINLFCSKEEVATLIKNYGEVRDLCDKMTKGCSVLYDADLSALSLLRMMGYFGIKSPYKGVAVDKAELEAYKHLLAKDLVKHKIASNVDALKADSNKDYINKLINDKVNKIARSKPLEALVKAFVENNILISDYRKNLIYENTFCENCEDVNVNFAEFFVQNFDEIMGQKLSIVKENEQFNKEFAVGIDGKRRFSSIYNDFDIILCKRNKKVLSRSNNQRLNLADCELDDVYSGVLEGNEEFAKLCGQAHMTPMDFEKAQNLFEQGKKVKNEQVLKVKKDCNDSDVRYRFIEKDDPISLVLGNITNCCQRIRYAGESCVEVGVTNPNSGFVVIEYGDKIIGQSWVWYDEKSGTIALDNIEVPDIFAKVVNYAKKEEVNECVERLCDNFVSTMRADGHTVNNVVIGCNATDIDALYEKYFLETSFNYLVNCPFIVNGKSCYSDVAIEGQYIVYRNGKPFTKEMGKEEKERRKALIMGEDYE